MAAAYFLVHAKVAAVSEKTQYFAYSINIIKNKYSSTLASPDRPMINNIDKYLS
jgi:hypothetical protein